MVYWFIVLSFWSADGGLSRHTSTLFPTKALCEAAMSADLDERFEKGTATGVCVPSPSRTPDLPPFIPGLKKQDT